MGYVKDEEFCKHPEPPANGRFVCETKNHDFTETNQKLESNIIESYKTLAPESVCHVQCNRSHSIPYHLYPLSTIQCTNGAWNSTDIEFCYKKQPQRRHLPRRHQNLHAFNQQKMPVTSISSNPLR